MAEILKMKMSEDDTGEIKVSQVAEPKEDSDIANKKYVDTSLNNLYDELINIKNEIVDELPEVGESGIIYFVKRSEPLNYFGTARIVSTENTITNHTDYRGYYLKIQPNTDYTINILGNITAAPFFIRLAYSNSIPTIGGTIDEYAGDYNNVSPVNITTKNYKYLIISYQRFDITNVSVFDNQNIYDEYIYLSETSSYEKIGSTTLDLTDYLLKTEAIQLINSEIVNALAGEY